MTLDEKNEFYVRHTRPFFGVISAETDIKVDQEIPKSIRHVRIAPIWQLQEDYQHALQHRDEVSLKIKTDVLQPYLQTGGLPSYIEKGETLMICDQEFFVNDCYPREGTITAHTQMEIEVGFTKEVFNRKQVLAD